MNHTLAITQRELVEKRFVLVAPAAAAVIVLLLPLAPRVPGNSWQAIYAVGSAIFALAFAVGLSLILGATTIGRELTEKRLSFYFARPIEAPAIWFGKLIASAVLIAASFALAMLPALFAERKALSDVWSAKGIDLLGVIAVLSTALFFIAHVLSSIARSRSAWALIDLLAVVVLIFAGWSIAQPLLSHFAADMAVFVLEVFGWLALIAALATGAWQLSIGRTDRQQSHRAMSSFLWPSLTIALLICAAIVWWVVSATPADLTTLQWIEASPAGDRVFVSGNALHRRDYRPLFLIDTRNGGHEALGVFPAAHGFTGDGRKLVTLRRIMKRSEMGEVIVRDVASGRETETGLTLNHGNGMAFSADANRIAAISNGILNVYDVPSKTSIASKRLDQPNVYGMWFANPDVLRLYATTPQKAGDDVARTLEIFEYDIRSKTLSTTGRYQKTDHNLFAWANQDGSRLFVRSRDKGIDVLDGTTGALLFTAEGARRMSAFADGRFVATAADRVRVLDAHGALLREIPIEVGPEDVAIVRTMSGGKILVATRPRDAKSQYRVQVIDAASGAVLRSEVGLTPAGNESFFGDIRRRELSPDQLFLDAAGNLVRWNAITNEKNVVVRVAKG